MQPATVFVNVFNNHGILEAHDGVWDSRAEAIDAAESYADTYAFTLTDTGKIDLEPEFSEAWQAKKDFDATVDARIDEMKDARMEAEGRAS